MCGATHVEIGCCHLWDVARLNQTAYLPESRDQKQSLFSAFRKCASRPSVYSALEYDGWVKTYSYGNCTRRNLSLYMSRAPVSRRQLKSKMDMNGMYSQKTIPAEVSSSGDPGSSMQGLTMSEQGPRKHANAARDRTEQPPITG